MGVTELTAGQQANLCTQIHADVPSYRRPRKVSSAVEPLERDVDCKACRIDDVKHACLLCVSAVEVRR